MRAHLFARGVVHTWERERVGAHAYCTRESTTSRPICTPVHARIHPSACARDIFLIHPSLRLILRPLNNRLLPSRLSAINGGGFAGYHARSSDVQIKGKYAKRQWVGKPGKIKIGLGADGG
jgi:hypothetical protein